MKIEELKLSTRTLNCLTKAGITTVEELQEKTETEIRAIKNMSDRKIVEIRMALERVENSSLEYAPEESPVETVAEVPAIDEYNQNIGKIKKFLIDAAMDFCAVGYYLKEIRDKEQYKEAGYNSIWECAQAEFGLSKSAASRHMTMNDMYSVGGNSAELDKKYISFNKSQLQEMLSLPESEREKVTPATTVTEIRKLNPNSKASKESVATSQQPEPDKPDEKQSIIKEEKVKPHERGCITGKSKYGVCSCCGNNGTVECCAQCSASCNSRCGWLDETQITEAPNEQEDIILTAVDNNLPDEAEKVSTESVAISQQAPAEDPAEVIIDGTYREIVEETPEIKPLELPALKNMEQREEFIKGYKEWPVWTKNELTEETFYRFDLPDGSSIVVRSYPTWLGWKKIDVEYQKYYLLKPGYHHFADTEVNMTVLKDHLKEVQKNQK